MHFQVFPFKSRSVAAKRSEIRPNGRNFSPKGRDPSSLGHHKINKICKINYFFENVNEFLTGSVFELESWIRNSSELFR